jgi:hypothetical protein
MTILASTRIRQKWRIFGEYSNSTNLPASGHCLILTLIENELKNVLKKPANYVIFDE